MKLGVRWILSMFFILLLSCGNSEKKISKAAQKELDSIPRFDSLNWNKQFKFKKANSVEKNIKKSFINQFYNDFWVKSNASGGLLVAQHGEIIFEAYNGSPDFSRDAVMTADTPIHLASISKILTAMAILKLVEFDKIHLSKNVDAYLDEFPYPDVSVESLLNHRSGLPNYLDFSEDKKYWDKKDKMSNQDVLDILINKTPPALGVPNKRFFYNNTNYVILALLIEKVTGLSYPVAMEKMVFKPLGMKSTFVMEFDRDADIVSRSYYNNGRDWGYDHLDKTYGDKNIYSTPRDLLRMDIAMYSSKFLPKKLKEKAWQGYSYESKGVKNYGYGMRIMEWPNDSKILYHNGKWHGNNTVYVRDFQNETTIIALGNRINRNIYTSFKLVGLFGDYPIQYPESKIKGSKSRNDSLKELDKDIDSVKQSTPKSKKKKKK